MQHRNLTGIEPWRPEGPEVHRPGREAGIGGPLKWSAEGAEHPEYRAFGPRLMTSRTPRPDGRGYALSGLRPLSKPTSNAIAIFVSVIENKGTKDAMRS